jgi:hypothetical protein
MNPPDRKTSRENRVATARGRAVLLVSGVLVLVGVGVALWPILRPTPVESKDTAERVQESDNRRQFDSGVLRNGRIYKRIQGAGADFLVQTFSLVDGTVGTLFRHDIRDRTVGSVFTTDTELMAVIAPQPTQKGTAPGIAGPMQVDPDRVSVDGKRVPVYGYRQKTDPPQPLQPGERRLIVPRQMQPDAGPTRLYRVSLDGGAIREMTLDAPNYAVTQVPHVLTKQGLFWVKLRTSERTVVLTQVSGRMVAIEEVSPVDDLMFSPVDGGKARLWQHGFHSRLQFTVSGDGLYFYQSSLTQAANGLSSDVLDWTKRISLTNPKVPPVTLPAAEVRYRLEFEGRVYWVESETFRTGGEETPGTSPLQSGRVVSCQIDGTDRRVIWEGRDGRGAPQILGPLFVHQGRLYVIYRPLHLPKQDIPAPASNPQGGPAVVRFDAKVARLHPDKSAALGSACAIPVFPSQIDLDDTGMPMGTGEYVDGGYFYFSVEEYQPKSPLDFLSYMSTERRIAVLYRVRLPE